MGNIPAESFNTIVHILGAPSQVRLGVLFRDQTGIDKAIGEITGLMTHTKEATPIITIVEGVGQEELMKFYRASVQNTDIRPAFSDSDGRVYGPDYIDGTPLPENWKTQAYFKQARWDVPLKDRDIEGVVVVKPDIVMIRRMTEATPTLDKLTLMLGANRLHFDSSNFDAHRDNRDFYALWFNMH